MVVKTYPYGPLASNMYLLETCSGNFLIDPSVYPDDIKDNLPSSLDAIICTHGHFDHINAVDMWASLFPKAKIYIHQLDANCFTDSICNCSSFFMNACKYTSNALDVMNIEVDGMVVIDTPGHSQGSICLYYSNDNESVIFTGDTLFRLGIGRSDLPGGSEIELEKSLLKLSNFPSNTIVYPGHGPNSTLGFEIENNPYL